MLEYLDKLQKEDMESLLKKRETQRNLMKDVAQANEVSVISGLVHPASFSLLFALDSSKLSVPVYIAPFWYKNGFVKFIVECCSIFKNLPFVHSHGYNRIPPLRTRVLTSAYFSPLIILLFPIVPERNSLSVFLTVQLVLKNLDLLNIDF